MSAQLLDNVNPTRLRQTVAWTEQRSQAAIVLASGGTKQEAANAAGVNRSTIYEWLGYPEFAAEVDRLSLMIHISSRAERLRIAMRVAKARVGEDDSVPQTDKDLLDWLKFAQSETDGAKIDLSKLAEMLSGEGAQQDVVDGGSNHNRLLLDQAEEVIETTATTTATDNDGGPSSSDIDHEDLNPS